MNTIEFSPAELAALKKEHAPAATDEQFELWVADCKRRGLMPVRDVLLQTRSVEEYDPSVRAKVRRNKSYYITTIGAFRKIAEGTGKYAGQLPAKWVYLDEKKRPTIETEIPLPDPEHPEKPLIPWAVKVTLLRKDFDAPITVSARFWAYAQTTKYEGKEVLTSMWRTRGVEQIEKCCEALALRKGFPEVLGGLYIAEEMMKGDDEQEQPTPVAPLTEAPKAAVVPEINHAPATPTNEPRPSEPKTLVEVVLKQEALPKQEAPKPETSKEVVAAPVQKDNPKPTNERCRDLIAAGVSSAPFKAYILNQAGVSATKEVPKDKWPSILNPLEEMLKSMGKEAVNTHISEALKPAKEEAF